jgi:UDP-N-acetylmuramate--alanine ligase
VRQLSAQEKPVEFRAIEETPFVLRPGMHLHLVGIGGSGLSAIAWVLLGRGFTVSGSDLERNALTEELAASGATVFQGHSADNVAGAEALIVSSAIPDGNVELVAAREADLPVMKRSDFLRHLMADTMSVAVAGTHGKTTTTSLIAHTLLEAGRDPSVIVGGVLPSLGRNGRAGQSDLFVVEADEYDHMFLGLRPRIEVITNVEHDHPDLFPTPEAYGQAFQRFIGRLPAGGKLIVCQDDAGVRQLLETMKRDDLDVITYGLADAETRPDLRAVDLRPNQLGGTDFVVQKRGKTLGLVRVRVPGAHNVRNALAAIAVCEALDVPFAELVQALASFGGVKRRFQVLGDVGDVTVIDDYAHHPTEIRATLAAARQHYAGRRLWAVWQPHTYSRTQLLLEAFGQSFVDADRVLVLDIYRSRERETMDVNSGQVVAQMQHPNARHVEGRRKAAQYILDRIRPGDVVLTLGAGDSDEVGQWILEGLNRRIDGKFHEEG